MMKLSSFINSKQKLIDLTAGLLAFSLPISTALPNILLVPLGLLIIFNLKDFRKVNYVPLLIFALSIFFIIVMAILSSTILEDIELYSRYALVIVLFIFFTQVENKSLVEYLFLAGAFIALAGSSIAIIQQIYQNPDFLLGNGEIVNQILWLERPYFGAILSLCVFICLKNAENTERRYDLYLLALIFIGFSIYISARLSIALNCLLIFLFLLRTYRLNGRVKVWSGLIITMLIALSLGLSNSLISRMYISNDFEKTKMMIKEFEPRFVIWPCAIGIIKEDVELLTGLKGYDEVEEKLTYCYNNTIDNESKRHFFLQRKFNTHNQFLDFFLLGGIIPFLLLIIMFFQTVFSKRSSFELKLIFFLFFAFFLIENVLHRQLGCYLFGIFMALYSSKKDD